MPQERPPESVRPSSRQDNLTTRSIGTPTPLVRLRGSLAAWRQGGAGNAWGRALWWSCSDEGALRSKGAKLAERLQQAGISAKDTDMHSVFQAIDRLVLAKAPTEKDWISEDSKQATQQAWAVLEMAMASGMNINQKHYNNYRDTPLHRAVAAGHEHLTDMLLRHGADPNARDGNGYTPLSAALDGFAERVGGQESREKTARQLIAHEKTNLSLGRRQRTHYVSSESEIQHYETSILAFTAKFPKLLVELTELGAPTSWTVPGQEINRRKSIPGDEPTPAQSHVIFMVGHDVWSEENEPLMARWLSAVKDKDGPLADIRSAQGLTPAMEFIQHGELLMGGWRGRHEEEEYIEARVRTSIQRFVDHGLFRLADKTEHGSTIWHALFMKVDDSTLPTARVLMEYFPETRTLIGARNDGGVAPADMLRHMRDDGGEYISTPSGKALAGNRTHYDKSWNSTFDALLAATQRQALHNVAHDKPIERPDVAPSRNRPRL